MALQEFFRTRYAPHLEGSQFIDLIAECKEILAGMVKMLEHKAIEVVEDPKPKVDDKSGSEVVTELAPLQKEVSSWFTEVEELPNEIFIDLPPEPTMELVPFLTDIGSSIFLISSDVYNPL